MGEKEILSSLDKNQNVLAVCKTLNPEKKIMGIYKSIISKYKRVCIVTTNKTSSVLMERFNKYGVDYSNCFFIDCVSSKMMRAVSNKQVHYISSPYALTEISLRFSSVADNYDIMVFDNLDSLLMYNQEVFVLRFLNNIMSRVHQKKIKALYLVMMSGKEKLVGDVSLFADESVEIK